MRKGPAPGHMTDKQLLELRILNDTVTFGIICFDPQKNPQITMISDNMLSMLKVPEDGSERVKALDICRQNIFMIIPPEDRRRFELYTGRVSRHGRPISGEMDLLCLDGSRIHCYGWISKDETDDNAFRIVCIDISEWSRIKKDQDTKRFVNALSAVYDDIFEFDYSARTVKCVYSKYSPLLKWVKNVPMDMKEASDRWILHRVPPKDREKLRSFFSAEAEKQRGSGAGEASIQYSVKSSDGTEWLYKGISVRLSPYSSLFCCRKDYESTALPKTQRSWSGKGPEVQIRTFGYFDVFVDGKPIAFRNEKSKELFALLVDRRGGFVSSEEAISFLWEDAPADSVTQSRYRKVALRLKRTLEEYGISDAIESVNGKRRLATERVKCDLLDYLSGRPEHAQLFKGSYLSNYSWGENTLAELMHL